MKNSEYILYLDMDGVLVDYDGGWWAIAQQLGVKPVGNEFSKEDRIRVHKQTVNPSFWANLGWEKGGEELWKAATDLFENIHILSSTATKKDVERGKIVQEGKMTWLAENLPHLDMGNVHIVAEGVEKANFANHLSILVDDRKSTIQAFTNAGGFGILHYANMYRKTIRELQEIAEPISLGEIVKRLPIMRRRFWKSS